MKLGLVALMWMSAGGVFAETIVTTYEPGGVQVADQTALCAGTSTCVVGTEDFNSWTGGGFTFTTAPNLADQTITMSYSGGFHSYAADAFGGAGGTGYYPEIFSSDGSYTLDLSTNGLPGVNYFGLWFSALDAGNLMQFYDGSTLVYSFTPADFISLVGACPNPSNPFCGNPNNGEDGGEQFAFLNFFDLNGNITQIVFSESAGFGGGFESDNHTVGYLDPIHPSGNTIGTPEPASFGLLLIGAAAMAFYFRWRRSLERETCPLRAARHGHKPVA